MIETPACPPVSRVFGTTFSMFIMSPLQAKESSSFKVINLAYLPYMSIYMGM